MRRCSARCHSLDRGFGQRAGRVGYLGSGCGGKRLAEEIEEMDCGRVSLLGLRFVEVLE